MIRAQGDYVVVQPTNVRMEALGVNPVRFDVAAIVAQSIVVGFELRVFRKERLVLRGEFLVRHGRLAHSLTAAPPLRRRRAIARSMARGRVAPPRHCSLARMTQSTRDAKDLLAFIVDGTNSVAHRISFAACQFRATTNLVQGRFLNPHAPIFTIGVPRSNSAVFLRK